jgi:quercetin dioxygenase-like cupin family protein
VHYARPYRNDISTEIDIPAGHRPGADWVLEDIDRSIDYRGLGNTKAALIEVNMRTLLSTVIAGAVLCGTSGLACAQTDPHVIASVNEAQWAPAPPMLPPGAQIAVLAGNPTQAVPYTIRLKFPAHYAIPAHSHPTDENVVVVSGALTFGMGDRLTRDARQNKTLTTGGFALMPAGMNHYAFTRDQETTIVLYGQGPVEFKYVNPADDPRHARGTR